MGVEHHDNYLCDANSDSNSYRYCHRHSYRYLYRYVYRDSHGYRDRNSYRDGYGPNPNAISRLWQHGFFAGPKRQHALPGY